MARTCGQSGFALAALAVCAGLASLCFPRAAEAQTIQFPRSAPATTTAPGIITAPAPTAGATTVNPYTGGSFSTAPFDPYSSSGPSAHSFWSNTPPSNTTGVFAQPPPPTFGAPAPIVAPPGVGSPYGPPPASPYYSGAPQYVFPNGVGQPWDLNQSVRFIQDLRLRHTWVEGDDDPNDLDINDTDMAVTFTWPDFLWGNQPLFISPAFALHLWDGPSGLTADLPPTAYSAYLDFQYATDPALLIGAELGFRVGVYSDFNVLNEDSLRIQGLGLLVAHLTPTVALKGGVMYLDRNRIKLLPAGGILWTPTPQVRFDIFFPQPKLAAYLTTIGRYDVWWYVAAEYGGGSWTIERADGTEDRIDINDIRVSSGLEWTGPRGFTAFFESGYVFEREVLYVFNGADNFNPDDAFMVRAGFSW